MLVYTIYYNHCLYIYRQGQKNKVLPKKTKWGIGVFHFEKRQLLHKKQRVPSKTQTSHMQLLSVCFCLYLLVQEYILQQLNNCRCTLWKCERLSDLFPKRFICTNLDFCVESFSFCFSNLQRVLCWKFNTEKKWQFIALNFFNTWFKQFSPFQQCFLDFFFLLEIWLLSLSHGNNSPFFKYHKIENKETWF